MQLKTIVTFIIIAIFLSSCNSREKEEKKADEQLKRIEQLINDGKYNDAKSAIDTIHLLFPKLVNKRKIAVAYKDTIVRRESSAILANSLQILPAKQQEHDSLLKDFKLEKNEKYQQFGNYVYKSQITEQNTSRNYLKFYVDENADLYLTSNVIGNKIEHFAIQLTTNNLSVATDTLNRKGVFHQFTDEGLYRENLTLKNESDSTLAAFVANNLTQKIKVVLIGKKKFSYYLSDQDKKAIAATYQFWIVKRDLKILQKEIEKATVRIGNIKLRYQN